MSESISTNTGIIFQLISNGLKRSSSFDNPKKHDSVICWDTIVVSHSVLVQFFCYNCSTNFSTTLSDLCIRPSMSPTLSLWSGSLLILTVLFSLSFLTHLQSTHHNFWSLRWNSFILEGNLSDRMSLHGLSGLTTSQNPMTGLSWTQRQGEVDQGSLGTLPRVLNDPRVI